MKGHTFISYESRDRAEAETIRQRLADEGIVCWMAPESIGPGRPYSEAIIEAIEACDAFVLVLSENANHSPFVHAEAERAFSKRKLFCTVRIRPVPPGPSLELFVSGSQWVEAWGTSAKTHFAELVELLSRVAAVRSTVSSEAVSPPASVEPLGSHEPTSSDAGSEVGACRDGPELRYPNIFQIATLRIPFVPILTSCQDGANEFRKGEVHCECLDEVTYTTPDDFPQLPPSMAATWEPKCRLESFEHRIHRPALDELTFRFSRISYADYLRTGEHLEVPLPSEPGKTLRDRYAPRLDPAIESTRALPRICGVGVYVLTRDHKVLLSKHSASVQVYGASWSYSASGTMDWNDRAHPFDEVARECYEEIGYELDTDHTRLFDFGLDTKKLYFQFSFFEQSPATAAEILRRAPFARDYSAEMERVVAVPFELESIVERVTQGSWEPAAAASLLVLCAKKYGLDNVERALDPATFRKELRRRMTSSWEHRAQRDGLLAVMSTRYPAAVCEAESQRFIAALMRFIGDDLDDRDVLEVGCGIGRFTRELLRRAATMTCIDISAQMIERNRADLGQEAAKVRYIHGFAQDYAPQRRHEVALCSLVLIHCLHEVEFHDLVEAIARSTTTVFLAEHIADRTEVSPETRLRTEDEILLAFRQHGFFLARRDDHRLFDDHIVFLKLTS